jgi:hypothetical protein
VDHGDLVAVLSERSDGLGAAMQQLWIFERRASEFDDELHLDSFE